MPADPKPLRPGDLVYRVVEWDSPENDPHTWKVMSVAVERASVKQIKLKTYFSSLYRVQYEPRALGRIFFATPEAAVAAFLSAQRSELESLERHRKNAERAIAWAIAQEKVA